MKKALLAFLLLGAAGVKAQPKDAPLNVPVGTIDTFYAIGNVGAWIISVGTGDTMNKMMNYHCQAWLFMFVDNRQLVPYANGNGPCRPKGECEWQRIGIANHVGFGIGSELQWLPADFCPPYLGYIGNDQRFLSQIK